MKQAFKCHIYGILHEPMLWKGLIFAPLVILILSGAAVMINNGEITLLENYNDIFSFMSILYTGFLLVIAGFLLCNDFEDKTFNYEVLVGKTRLQVFISRVVVIFGVIFSFYLLYVFSIVFCIRIWGIEDTQALKWLFIRLIMMGMEFMRMTSFMIFMSLIIKQVEGVISGICLIFLPQLIALLVGATRVSYLLISTAITNLGTPSYFTKYNVVVGGIVEYTKADWSLKSGNIIEVIITSVFFTVLYLYLGWQYFKKDDL